MTDESRPYRKRKRAEQEERTRRRITEAVVELHRTVGPARTTITEVADRAGVSRVTVYNHFPEEADLIRACSAHWAARNPFPDPAEWAAVEDPAARLEEALGALYSFYESNEDMLANVLRDAAIVEPLGEVMDQGWRPYMEALTETLLPREVCRTDGEELVRAAIAVVVDFGTWVKLRDSLDDEAARVEIAVRMVRGAAPTPLSPPVSPG